MAICNATDCQLEVFDDNKCILHCSKKTWRQGYHLKFSEKGIGEYHRLKRILESQILK